MKSNRSELIDALSSFIDEVQKVVSKTEGNDYELSMNAHRMCSQGKIIKILLENDDIETLKSFITERTLMTCDLLATGWLALAKKQLEGASVTCSPPGFRPDFSIPTYNISKFSRGNNGWSVDASDLGLRPGQEPGSRVWNDSATVGFYFGDAAGKRLFTGGDRVIRGGELAGWAFNCGPERIFIAND